MKVKKEVLIISIIFWAISFALLLFTDNGNKINSICISIFAGCLVSSRTLYAEYKSNIIILKKQYYSLMINFYSYLVQYRKFIENYIKSNGQLTEKMLEFYSINLDNSYSKMALLDDNFYDKDKNYQDLIGILFYIKNAISNSSKNVEILVLQKRIDNIRKFGINKEIFVRDFEKEFDELYELSCYYIKSFEEKFIIVIDKKQKVQFENDKSIINEKIYNYKYKRKFM